ncbi:MAG: hypothetical protein ACOVRB_12260 [Akkermansiaceae bacterium]
MLSEEYRSNNQKIPASVASSRRTETSQDAPVNRLPRPQQAASDQFHPQIPHTP